MFGTASANGIVRYVAKRAGGHAWTGDGLVSRDSTDNPRSGLEATALTIAIRHKMVWLRCRYGMVRFIPSMKRWCSPLPKETHRNAAPIEVRANQAEYPAGWFKRRRRSRAQATGEWHSLYRSMSVACDACHSRSRNRTVRDRRTRYRAARQTCALGTRRDISAVSRSPAPSPGRLI